MKADFHINDLTSSIKMEVKIRGMAQFRFRLWLVVCLLRVVSWVSPIEVESTKE